ncbi:aldo/keto reductase [Lentzea sp. DG1S-22]|uniref:aldo/keto reductase n=1 Tax=Lentzea sp. DG1S-22 TaxID=3108822 RepID=UPI002E7A2316|nr:aldo/keto reductase [Lentzea sp. DG1S-22]WVH82538.1 aldo/keto reductase [Lentzea sp. DG1S-22]
MTVLLPSGETIPALGMGTWMMAERPGRRADEIAALRTGLDLGLSLVDTAEMYANGASEELVGEAIAGRRDEVFLVSKVLPSHASAAGTVRACEASLRRLGTDRLDLYLLHWRGGVPFEQTLEGFTALVESGKIRHWGVSNLDLDDMRELTALPGSCQANQILYNLSRRGPEHDLLPWHASTGIPVMAYSPVEQGRLLDSPALASVAGRHGATPAQVALAWVLRLPHVNAIPKAGTAEHVRENARALELRLTTQDLADLDTAFPPPSGPTPLAVL